MRSADEGARGRRARLAVAALGVAVVLGALAGTARLWARVAGGKVAVYESRAILEVRPSRPGGEVVDAEREGPAMRVEMLTWTAVRDIVIGGKVDFGFQVDPDDRRQLEHLHKEIVGRVRVQALSYKHIEVAYRSPDPELNAGLVNQMVKRFVGESRRRAQEDAKDEVVYFREKLVARRAALDQANEQIQVFARVNPWLSDDVAALHRRYEGALEREAALGLEHGELEASIAALRKQVAKEKSSDVAAKVEAAERRLKRVAAERLAASRQAAELKLRVEKTPKLLREQRRLLAQRTAVQVVVDDLVRDLRSADKRFQEVLTEAYSSRFRVVEYARDDRTPVGAETPRPVRAERPTPAARMVPREAAPVRLEPVIVEGLDKGDIIFSQLDRNGFVTSISHFFRELGPDPDDAKKGFTIHRKDENSGVVELYRLRNVGTGEVREFRKVGVIRLPDGRWRIGQAGWQQIEKELAARMRVRVRRVGRD